MGFSLRLPDVPCGGEVTTGDKQKRTRLVPELRTFVDRESAWMRSGKPPAGDVLSQAETLFADLESTYDTIIFDGVPRLGLLTLGIWLCRAYFYALKYNKTLARALGVLRGLGYRISMDKEKLVVDRTYSHAAPEVVDAAVYAANVYFKKGRGSVGKQFQDFAKDMYKTLYGTLRDVEKMYGAL